MKKHRNKLINFNIIAVSSVLILIYIIYIVSTYANKTKIFSYQVKEGTLAESSIYTGIAIRDEESFTATTTGYVQYFAREGEHVGVGDMVYTIDESGSLMEMLDSNQGKNGLSKKDLASLKTQISEFSLSFDTRNFTKTYDFKYSMDGEVLKLANMNILTKLGDVNSKSYSDLVKISNAPKAGYVVYSTDGYESISINGINESYFKKEGYDKKQLLNTELVDSGSTIYKLIKSEDWNIVIQLSEGKAKELQDAGYVKVRFLEDQRECQAGITVCQGTDGYYGILSFNNSVMNYCNQRFIDIEILNTEKAGLKIPVSSLVHKEFFLVPKDFVLEQSEDNKLKFLKKTFKEDGTISADPIKVEVYSENDDYYYIDDSQLRIGDYLIKADTQDEYPVSTKGELVGVYNMNKGYADFRRVEILYQNEEYAIVESHTTYGLNVYDFIVLDSSAVKENDILY